MCLFRRANITGCLLSCPGERVSTFQWLGAGCCLDSRPRFCFHVGSVTYQINLLETVLNMYSAHL